MKKFLFVILGIMLASNFAFAKTDLKNIPDIMMQKNPVVLESGSSFEYPIPEGAVIQCYGEKVDGSIDDFEKYNDYFLMRNGHLYSNTMHKIYKPNKADKLKKVDRVSLTNNNKILKMYDPLWEASIRHHMRIIKINIATGEYYMTGTQDNWMWYRNITATGYCRVIYPKK